MGSKSAITLYSIILSVASKPFDNGSGTQGWEIFYENESPATPGTESLLTFAICIDATP